MIEGGDFLASLFAGAGGIRLWEKRSFPVNGGGGKRRNVTFEKWNCCAYAWRELDGISRERKRSNCKINISLMIDEKKRGERPERALVVPS